MPSVVIAGGTSASLGKAIVKGILTLTPNWKPIILSRSSFAPAWLLELLASEKVELRQVNYTDHASLVLALSGAHTVISILLSGPSTWFATQIALLSAAKEAGVKRFAPSEFGIGIKGTPQVDGLIGSLDVWRACEESGLEWTRYECGLFLNYLGFAAKDDRREEALGGREKDGEWFFFPSQRRAEIPVKSDGTFPRITMTAVEDIGKYVAKSLTLDRWDTVSYIAGDTLPMDEVVRTAEAIMGQNWEITTVSPEEFKQQLALEHGEVKRLWLQLGLIYTHDAMEEGVLEPQLNRLFPELKPITVEAYMRKYYI
jgi:uncharacterized protein YbjT (DUF2867 family)